MEPLMKTITEKDNNKILPFIKGVMAFMLVTLSLFHVFFNAKSKLVPLNNQKYSVEINRRNDLQNQYLEDLKNRKIDIEQYYVLATDLVKTSKQNVAKINAEKRQINRDHSFRGRSSFHFWIFVFGLVTALFFFSCKSLHDDFSRGSTFKFHFVSLTGILVSGFWFIHLIFLTQKDFTQNKYVLILVIAASLFAAFTYFLVKYYTYKDQIIYRQLSFIERVKRIYYKDMIFKAMYAEESGKSYKSGKLVDDCIDEFHEDLKRVTDNI